MIKTKLNKIGNLIDKIKDTLNSGILSDFLEWFYEKLDINFNRKIKGLEIQKGDIFYINLGKNIGSELNKNRPCIIYSKKFANNGDTAVIIPLRSFKGKVKKNLFVFLEADIENKLIVNSITDITGIRQISKKRMNGYIGKVNKVKLDEIDKKVSKIFGIKNKE